MLAAGSVVFATAPIVGRTRAMAFGLMALFGGLSHRRRSRRCRRSSQPSATAVLVLAGRSDHRPMAGRDRLAVGRAPGRRDRRCFLALGVVVVRAAGHRRRGTDSAGCGCRRCRPGSAGPFRRQLADRTGDRHRLGRRASGLYAVLIVGPPTLQRRASDAAADRRPHRDDLSRASTSSQPSGVLQLTFFGFGSFIFGLAGASFLAGWASDEGRRRLDLVLSTPLSRATLGGRGAGSGVMAAIGV